MSIDFYKYHGTGNDFIILDDMEGKGLASLLTQEAIARYCHRRFGVGADGLIILEGDEDGDFFMNYFNADGRPSTLCGNGSRCAISLAQVKGYVDGDINFKAIDGLHKAQIQHNVVHLEMRTGPIRQYGKSSYLVDTGSPHLVKYVDDFKGLDVVGEGRRIRNNESFEEEGINVNFIKEVDGILNVATYERGVEDETFSCGTGVVASAVVHAIESSGLQGEHTISVQTKGGGLQVRLNLVHGKVSDVWLIGPAVQVFSGILEV